MTDNFYGQRSSQAKGITTALFIVIYTDIDDITLCCNSDEILP